MGSTTPGIFQAFQPALQSSLQGALGSVRFFFVHAWVVVGLSLVPAALRGAFIMGGQEHWDTLPLVAGELIVLLFRVALLLAVFRLSRTDARLTESFQVSGSTGSSSALGQGAGGGTALWPFVLWQVLFYVLLFLLLNVVLYVVLYNPLAQAALTRLSEGTTSVEKVSQALTLGLKNLSIIPLSLIYLVGAFTALRRRWCAEHRKMKDVLQG